MAWPWSRDKSEFEPTNFSRLHHIPTSQWADEEDPHLKSSQLLLPPALQNSTGLPARRAICCSTAGFSIHFIMTRLLQLTVVSSARVNHSAAYDECSGSSCHELVIVWPCETSIKTATLAVVWAKNYIQALSVCASHPYRTSTTIFVRLCILSFCSQWQVPAEIDWLSCLHSAKNKN